jgi:hypothetical protein
MKARVDEAMEDWKDMSAALKQARHKKEFCDETAKKYWKMKAADFVREKRARVLHNNREAKKQETRRANRVGMGTPPPQEAPEEEEVKSRITNLWWLENELRSLDLRAKGAGGAHTGDQKHGVGEDAWICTDERGESGDDPHAEKHMTVSKAGTEAVAAAVAVMQYINTDECWMEKMTDGQGCGTRGPRTRGGHGESGRVGGGCGGRKGVCGDENAKRGEKCL